MSKKKHRKLKINPPRAKASQDEDKTEKTQVLDTDHGISSESLGDALNTVKDHGEHNHNLNRKGYTAHALQRRERTFGITSPHTESALPDTGTQSNTEVLPPKNYQTHSAPIEDPFLTPIARFYSFVMQKQIFCCPVQRPYKYGSSLDWQTSRMDDIDRFIGDIAGYDFPPHDALRVDSDIFYTLTCRDYILEVSRPFHNGRQARYFVESMDHHGYWVEVHAMDAFGGVNPVYFKKYEIWREVWCPRHQSVRRDVDMVVKRVTWIANPGFVEGQSGERPVRSVSKQGRETGQWLISGLNVGWGDVRCCENWEKGEGVEGRPIVPPYDGSNLSYKNHQLEV